MSITPVAGATYDLYREQLFNNPSTYTASGAQINSDEFRTNMEPQTPLRPNATPNGAYGTQPIQDSYLSRCKGDINPGRWTSTFPVIQST